MAKVTKLKTKRSHSDLMFNGLAALRSQRKYTDVTIICGEKQINAHRLILHVSSLYFQSIFNDDESLEQIEVNDIDSDVIEDVVEFLYTGELTKTISRSEIKTFQDILGASYILELTSLSDFCWKELLKMVTIDFFRDLWNLAENHKNSEAEGQIVELVAKNFIQICRKTEFLGLKGDQVKKVLQHPESSSMTADWMLNGILKWVKHDEENRRIFIAGMVPLVKVESLTSNYLAHVLNSETLITDSREYFQQLFALATDRLIDSDTKPHITQLTGAGPVPATRTSKKPTSIMLDQTQLDVTLDETRLDVTLDETQDVTRDDMQYVAGKMLACCGKEDEQDIIVVYDFKKKIWGPIKALPFPVVSGTAVVAISGFIYFIGGDDDTHSGSITVNKYHPATTSSTKVASLLTAVTQAGAASIHNKIYTIGGVSNGEMIDFVQRYDPERDRWSFTASTNNTHCLPNVVVLYDELYIVGSYCCTVIETYERSHDQWTVITQIPEPLKEHWPRAVAHQDRIWTWTNLCEQKFHVYDPLCNEWEEKNFKDGPSDVYGMWSMCSTAEQLEFIVVSVPGNSYHVYHSETELWLPLSSFPADGNYCYWQTVLA